MTKEAAFIAIVQAMFLANAVNLSLEGDAAERRHIFSASGAFIFMDEAVRAARLIPDQLSAQEAAHEFASWMLENLREDGDHVPGWFAR